MKSPIAGCLAVLSAALVLAVPARAQGMPKHEFGADVSLVYHNIGSPSSVSGFAISTPVDLRVGFVSQGQLSFEGRLVAVFATLSSGGQTLTTYSLTPDVNVLYKLTPGRGMHNLLGPYLTGGVGLGLTGVSVAGNSNSGLNMTVNAGVGNRWQMGSGAFRGEFFVAFTPANHNIGPDGTEIAVGLRLGVSLWN